VDLLEALRQAVGLIAGLDRYVLEVIAVTLQVSGVAVLIALALGVPLGAWLGLSSFPGHGFLVSLVNTGLAFPPVVVGLFVFLLLSNAGPLGFLDMLYSRRAMTLAQVLIAFPYVAAVSFSAVGSVPREVRLQALGLGASRLQSVWLVLREARLSLTVAVIAGFGAAISEVGAVLMVGGNIVAGGQNQTRVLTTAIVQETRMGNFDKALAFGIILLTIAFILNVLLTHAQRGSAGRWTQR
jgi:tungstate transport system permease protein